MNETKIFKNPEFGSIRTVEQNGEPWFVSKDVAKALGYRDTADALKKHVDVEDKRLLKPGEMPTLKMSNYGAYVINESGLYSLILSSKLPTAKKFKHWVTSEVLPSIRKTGGYNTDKTIQMMIEFIAQQQVINAKVLNLLDEMSNRLSCLEIPKVRLLLQEKRSDNQGGMFLPEADARANTKHLNALIKEYLGITGSARNYVLHRLYTILQQEKDISLDSYLDVYRAETGKSSSTALYVIAAHKELYESAVEIIERSIDGLPEQA